MCGRVTKLVLVAVVTPSGPTATVMCMLVLFGLFTNRDRSPRSSLKQLKTRKGTLSTAWILYRAVEHVGIWRLVPFDQQPHVSEPRAVSPGNNTN